MKINIGITEKNLQAIAKKLNMLLADETVLYTKTRNYHWNYEGNSFVEMHELFENHYTELAEQIDEIAERIKMLGQRADAKLKDYVKTARLTEQEYTTDQIAQIKYLYADHENLIRLLRKEIKEVDEKHGDIGTADFLTGLLRFHEKKAWMLRSYLK